MERVAVCCPVLLLFATSEEGSTDAGDMARWVKRLLCKHEDLSSIPRAYVKTKKSSVVVHTCNPGAGETEMGMFLAHLVRSRLDRERERPCLKPANGAR